MSEETSSNLIWEQYKQSRMNNPRTTDELIQLALSEQDEEAQADLVAVLQYRGTQEVLEAARRLCADPDEAKRSLGAWILGQNVLKEKTHHDGAVETLLGMLQHEESPQVLRDIAFSLGSMGDERAVEPLVKLKEHSHRDVRYGVVHGLFAQIHPLAIDALIDLTSDVDSEVRDWATFELGTIVGEIDTPELRDALYARVEDTDRDTRGEALVGLAIRRDERVIVPLIRELQSKNVGSLALDAATHMADVRLCPALLELRADIGEDHELDEALSSCGCENGLLIPKDPL